MSNFAAVKQYKKLLERYHTLISKVWWNGEREELVTELDRLWVKFNDKEKETVINYANELYLKRIA